MAIAVVLNTQNTPIPINTPNADSQNVYQNVSGKFKLAGADKNSNPIKFAFGVPGIFGSPAPYHLPTMSGVNKPKIADEAVAEGTTLEAVIIRSD